MEYESGFPWHPHRGMETITYAIEGAVRHEDSLGNKSLIEVGDVQLVTAGNKGVRFLLISGKPIGEPVAWYGPIVMNSRRN